MVDVSRYLTGILEMDATERRVRVQPGVVRNELNLALVPHGVSLHPKPPPKNRCMIGGMVGNHACGANSVVIYGSTRVHLISARAILSDGSVAEFGPLSPEQVEAKCSLAIRSRLRSTLRPGNCLVTPRIARRSRMSFPRDLSIVAIPVIPIDLVADCEPFTPGGPPFNFCQLLAGFGGTPSAFLTEITLTCEPLPPRSSPLVCVHCSSIDEALRANLVASPTRHGVPG